MRAKMKDNLIYRYKQILPKEYNEEVGNFLRFIEGKEVNLVFIGQDAFEEKDNNFWLPNELWNRL